MKRVWMLITATLVAVGCSTTSEVKAPQPENKALETAAIFGSIPETMPGGENDTPERVALGKKLYHETKLSINNQQSCASCHSLAPGGFGVDHAPTSTGAKGDIGGRNAPTVLNAGFHIAQFWDGRAADLTEQAKGPILNPIEMGMPHEKHALEAVSTIPEYQKAFEAAFPDAQTAITYQNLAEAIAAYERTLITTDRFDQFVQGDADALGDQEQRGLQQFVAVGCASCHMGALFGGSMYQKFGVFDPYKHQNDTGRHEVTGKEEDKYVFKVPSLRNIAKTAPYFHDGKIATLNEAVAIMAKTQLGKDLSQSEIDDIVAFLESLTATNEEEFAVQ